MALPGTAQVRVDPPVVDGSTVTFSWRQDAANPLQLRNRWSITYHGIALARMNRRVLYDVLLSLQVPVWNALAKEVEVHLPEPTGQITVDFWKAYHGAARVRFTGAIDTTEHYLPHRPRLRQRLGPVWRGPDVAVTFGGGKDSTLAQQALLERRGRRGVLLLHLVQHFSTDDQACEKTLGRSLGTILEPNLQRTRAPVQLVSTDYLAVLKSGSRAPRPHINLYVGAMLPALLHRGVHQVVFSRTALGYRIGTDARGRRTFTNPSGRPERLAHLRRYYAHVLHWDLHSESTHRAIGEFVSYGALLRCYPRAFAAIVMCTRTRSSERFCHDCPKCLEFALLGLAHGHLAPDLDYDRLLMSRTLTGLVEEGEKLQGTRAWHGAGGYVRQIGTASHFATWCHTLHVIDPLDPSLAVGAQARRRLVLLQEVWGPVPFPAVARLERSAVEASGPLGQEVAGVAARVYPVSTDGDDGDPRSTLLLVGDAPAQRDDAAIMPTPLLDTWATAYLGVHGAGDGVSPIT